MTFNEKLIARKLSKHPEVFEGAILAWLGLSDRAAMVVRARHRAEAQWGKAKILDDWAKDLESLLYESP